MNINTQPTLENEKVILYPLREKDFHVLYTIASDPKIWEQHPNKDRYKKEVFKTFFDGAMQSKGAFKIVDKATGNTIGSAWIYDYNEQESTGAWVSLAYVSLFSMFIAFIFWYKGLSQGGTATVGQLQLLQPFFGLALAASLLHESVSTGVLAVTVGVILCVAGTKKFAN